MVVVIVAAWNLLAGTLIGALAAKDCNLDEKMFAFDKFDLIVYTFANSLFFPIAKTLLSTFACKYDREETGPSCGTHEVIYPYLTADPCIACWQPEHQGMAAAAGVAMLYYAVSAPVLGSIFSRSYNGKADLQYDGLFALFERTCKLAALTFSILLPDYGVLSAVVVCLSQFAIAVYAAYFLPCQTLPFNAIKSGSFFAAALTIGCTFG